TSLLASGSGGLTDTLTFPLSGFNFVDVTASSGNVLIDTVGGSATPEPSTYLLMGTGLLMLGFFKRRKFASASC
ncbi:MAG: PEP-CTERM sorting domain-containing protein, partial [Candidatus Acidiferrales bacterium]